MKKIGIIAALDCEIDLFIKDFNAKKTEKGDMYKGEYCGHEIYLCLCGVGKVNAAICTQRLIDLADVNVIINSGVAGAVSPKLSVCDLAISECLTYHDFYPLDILDRYSPYSSHFVADKELVELAKHSAQKLKNEREGFNYETGMIVSGDRFVEDKLYKKELSEKFNAVCTEMEGAAVAHVAFLNKIPFVVIRAMSDKADEEADMSFDEMAAIAAKNAIYIVKDMISQM